MDSSAAVLVVFGVIGYLILRHCFHRTSFRWETLEWQQNVFESTGFGLLLFGLSRLAAPHVHAFADSFPQTAELHGYLASRVPFAFPGTVVLGTAIGLVIAILGNLVWPKDKALDLVVLHHGGRLRILLHDAHRTNRLVLLSLSSRKVYVGPVFVPPPLRNPSHVVIFPTVSGFRVADTLEIEWRTDYSSAYLEILETVKEGKEPRTELKHFQLVIPLDTILSATYFDREIYDRHFAPRPGTGASNPVITSSASETSGT